MSKATLIVHHLQAAPAVRHLPKTSNPLSWVEIAPILNQ